MYTFWKRAAPPASMEIFNAPSREKCTVLRERTNPPLQALVTLNDPQFVEAARTLAQRAIKEAGGDFDQRLNYITERLASRPFTSDEQTVVHEMYDKLGEHYATRADEAKQIIAVGESKADAAIPPVELAAWTMTVNELMNLDEVLNK
jgi:hypothetical protein